MSGRYLGGAHQEMHQLLVGIRAQQLWHWKAIFLSNHPQAKQVPINAHPWKVKVFAVFLFESQKSQTVHHLPRVLLVPLYRSIQQCEQHIVAHLFGQCLHKMHGLHGGQADCVGSALVELPQCARLVGGWMATMHPVEGELKSQLDPRVGAELSTLRHIFAEMVEGQRADFEVLDSAEWVFDVFKH